MCYVAMNTVSAHLQGITVSGCHSGCIHGNQPQTTLGYRVGCSGVGVATAELNSTTADSIRVHACKHYITWNCVKLPSLLSQVLNLIGSASL